MATLEAVDHDPFASGPVLIPGENGGPSRLIMNMGPKLEPVDHDPFAGEGTDYVGMGKAGGIGVAKGAIGLVGMAGDVQALARRAGDYIKDYLPTPPEHDEKTKKFLETWGGGEDMGPQFPLPTSHDIQGQVEKIRGPFREPQNQKERDA